MENNNLPSTNNSLAIVGFVLGIISFFLNFFGIVGISAVVVSSIALTQISKNSEKGKVFAILGIIFGAINIIYACITICSLF